jgi:hypothetical protein
MCRHDEGRVLPDASGKALYKEEILASHNGGAFQFDHLPPYESSLAHFAESAPPGAFLFFCWCKS